MFSYSDLEPQTFICNLRFFFFFIYLLFFFIFANCSLFVETGLSRMGSTNDIAETRVSMKYELITAEVSMCT